MQTDDDIVITGMGVVSPLGIGAEAFWNSLAARRSGVHGVRLFDASAGPAPFAGEVCDFDPKDLVRPRKNVKVMARDTQFAVAAVEMACQQAKLTEGAVDPTRKGLVLGCDMIHCQPAEFGPAFAACLDDRGGLDFANWGRRAMPAIFPLWLLKYLPNMPACHAAIAQDAQGPNNSVTLGDLSSLLAMGEGVRVLKRGAADVMVVGGAGSYVHPTTLVRSRLFELTKRRDDPAAASRPFDADRDGMVLGEGAAAFIIESRRHARERNATALARILAHVSGYAPPGPAGAPDVELLRRLIRQALERANVSSGDIGHVNAWGASTQSGDRSEAQAIRAELGDVPVTATKGHFGNLGAGSGAVEIVASLLGLRIGKIPPTMNFERPCDECPVNVVAGEPIAAHRSMFLKLGHCPTGQAAALILAAEGVSDV